MRYVLTLTLACGSPVRAQTAAVTVNGESITEDGIEQRTKLNFVNTHKQSVRQDVINELADDKGKIKEAEKLGVDLGDAQVENAYAQMCWRMHIAQEQLKNLWMATASISTSQETYQGRHSPSESGTAAVLRIPGSPSLPVRAILKMQKGTP